jgi:hypothetical protein
VSESVSVSESLSESLSESESVSESLSESESASESEPLLLLSSPQAEVRANAAIRIRIARNISFPPFNVVGRVVRDIQAPSVPAGSSRAERPSV